MNTQSRIWQRVWPPTFVELGASENCSSEGGVHSVCQVLNGHTLQKIRWTVLN